MNTNDLEKHVESRLGSTLMGASKEVRQVFQAGMFSPRKKQKANLFSLSLRTSLKQDIKIGKIKSIEEIDKIIDASLESQAIPESTASQEFRLDLIDNATFKVARGNDKPLKHKRVTLHDEGLQIHESAPDGSHLRVPWDEIVSTDHNGRRITLRLTNGSTIQLKAHRVVTKATVQDIYDLISKKACGVMEDNWN